MPQPIDVELIETADVARLIRRTPAAVRARVRRGQIPVAVVTPRGAHLFRRSDIQTLVQEMEIARRRAPTGEEGHLRRLVASHHLDLEAGR